MENINTQNSAMNQEEMFVETLKACRINTIMGGVLGTALAMGAERLSRNSTNGTVITAGVVGTLSTIGLTMAPMPLESLLAGAIEDVDQERYLKRMALMRAVGNTFISGFSAGRIFASYKKLESGDVASTDNDVLELE